MLLFPKNLNCLCLLPHPVQLCQDSCCRSVVKKTRICDDITTLGRLGGRGTGVHLGLTWKVQGSFDGLEICFDMKSGQSPTCLFSIILAPAGDKVQLPVQRPAPGCICYELLMATVIYQAVYSINSLTGKYPSSHLGRAWSEEKPTLIVRIGKSNGKRSKTAESHAAGIRVSYNKNSCVNSRPVSVEATGNPELTCGQCIPAGADVESLTESSGEEEQGGAPPVRQLKTRNTRAD